MKGIVLSSDPARRDAGASLMNHEMARRSPSFGRIQIQNARECCLALPPVSTGGMRATGSAILPSNLFIRDLLYA